MFTPAKLAVLLVAAISVAAVPSHVARNSHHHREIVARVAQPEVAPVAQNVARDVPAPAKRVVRRKRDASHWKHPNNGNGPSTPKQDSQPTTTPTPNPTPVPASTPTSTSASTPDTTPATTPNTNTGGSTQTGEGTFYDIGLGACGFTNSEPQLIAAVSHQFFDQFTPADGNPNQNTLCGKKLQVTYNGKTFSDIILADRCGGCAGPTDLDFSRAAFDRFADESVGRIDGITWKVLG